MALRSLLHGEICSFWETSQGKNRTSVNLGKKIFFCELIFCQRGEKICLLFQFLQNFWSIIFCERNILLWKSNLCSKSVNKLFPENVKFKKKDYHFRTEVVHGNYIPDCCRKSEFLKKLGWVLKKIDLSFEFFWVLFRLSLQKMCKKQACVNSIPVFGLTQARKFSNSAKLAPVKTKTGVQTKVNLSR